MIKHEDHQHAVFWDKCPMSVRCMSTTLISAMPDGRAAAATDQLSCTGAAPCDTIPKSTLSNHLKLLRATGLIETNHAGREMINTLRRDEFDRRFPGLLDAVLANTST